MTTEQLNFIERIHSCLVKYAPNYNIKCYPVIIAQAINESGWGKSTLAKNFHNYFGLKCGSKWKGRSVRKSTKEEYTVGVFTNVKANFRVYNSFEDGVKGYLDFINTKRYSNLKGIVDNLTYATNLKNDGYATSSTYVQKLLNLIKMYNLNVYAIKENNPTVHNKPNVNVGVVTDIPMFIVGKTYTTQAEMIVRTSPCRSSAPKGYNRLSKDGKKHDKDRDGALDKGTVVTCKNVVHENGNIWLQIPSGFVCGLYHGKIYLK